MKANTVNAACGLVLLILSAGCRTDVAVNFRNGTSSTVWVTSANTGRETEIPSGRFRKIPHGAGNLILKAAGNEKLTFEDITPFHVDRQYLGVRDNLVGVDSVVLSVRLETNMQLYVLLPRQKTVDQKVEQPKGYPKSGKKVAE